MLRLRMAKGQIWERGLAHPEMMMTRRLLKHQNEAEDGQEAGRKAVELDVLVVGVEGDLEAKDG